MYSCVLHLSERWVDEKVAGSALSLFVSLCFIVPMRVSIGMGTSSTVCRVCVEELLTVQFCHVLSKSLRSIQLFQTVLEMKHRGLLTQRIGLFLLQSQEMPA